MVASVAISSANNSLSANELNQLKSRLKGTWMTGDYDTFSRYMETDAHLFFRRLGITAGTRVLDVACGAGQLALIAARAGAKVTGCDIATNWIERARARATSEGLNVIFDEGDAEALPYPDASFEVVASLVGAMFAPRPELVAAELTRVCQPGGKIAMANWTPQGFVGQMFKTIAKYIAPGGMASPVLWGDEATVRERLKDGIAEVKCTPRFYQFEYPFPPEMVVQFFRETYGPMTRAFASLDAEGQQKLNKDLVELWTSHNRAEGCGTLVDAEYLEVIAVRGFSATDDAEQKIVTIDRKPHSRRAALLADRIEEGAERLAMFAARLTDEEWKMPVIESGQSGRTVGVLVHHVASMYPIEADVARAVATGANVTHVTWNVVHQINSKHAEEHAAETKEDTLALLRANGTKAAALIRTFTDEELDRVAPFSLSYGAPMTAQFVIEDHALRHSWHHLSRLRKTVGERGENPKSKIQ
jgi:ubiquinone/menaquinone biosynthesis C-methylase UbiE